MRAFVDGRDVASQELANGGDATLVVPLRPGDNRVTVLAFDALGFASNEAIAAVRSDRKDLARRDVWLVTVGVGSYPHLPDDKQLPAARHDAQGIADAFAKLAGDDPKLPYARSHITTLLDDAVTPAAVTRAIDGLSEMKENDLAIVLFAGHGYKPRGEEMVFLLGTLGASGHLTVGDVHASSIGWRALGAGLERARGRVVLLLDACQSGAITKDTAHTEDMAEALLHDDRAGLLVFAAAKGRQPSLEPGSARGLVLDPVSRRAVSFDPEASHGFFTGALLAALADPGTDSDRDGWVEMGELIDEVTERVALASHFEQVPWVAKREYFGDFVIAPTAGVSESGPSLRPTK